MKKSILIFTALLACFSDTISARPGGILKHVLEVESYSDWGRGYLTIIDNHVIFANDEPIYLTWTTNQSEIIPDRGLIITAINNNSAKYMTPAQFYALTDTASSFILKVEDIHAKEYVLQLFVKNERQKIIDRYYGMKYFVYNNPQDSSNLATRKKFHGTIFNSVSDEKFDFRDVHTYDYIIRGDDPLNDEKILDHLFKFGMERDTENPDVLFTIAKNTEERISTTYIPPTSRTINTGSTTTPDYNYITKTYSYITKQNYQTIHEGGYTETTKTANIFLELAALDAKKVNDNTINHAPIIWQFTANRNVLNYNFQIADEYRSYATWGYMPPVDRFGEETKILYEVTGLIPDKDNSSMVAEVIKSSRAEMAGFQKGDIILKYEYTTTTKGKGFNINKHHIVSPSQTKTESHTIYIMSEIPDERDSWTKKNSKSFSMISSLEDILENEVICTIKRNGKKIRLALQPKRMRFSRYFWLNNEQLQKVRNKF